MIDLPPDRVRRLSQDELLAVLGITQPLLAAWMRRDIEATRPRLAAPEK